MRQIVLFDTEESYGDLLPLSFTRPVADFRLGILTIRQKWERLLEGEYSYRPVEYLIPKFGTCSKDADSLLFISGSILPDAPTVKAIAGLKPGQALFCDDRLIGFIGSEEQLDKGDFKEKIEVEGVRRITFVFDIFIQNDREVREDYELITRNRVSQPVPEDVMVIGGRLDADRRHPDVFIEEGAVLDCCTLNIKEGPIYIGVNATVMEGALLRGPLALCEKATIKMGAKIYSGTTFGPYCKVGGEVSNTVIFGYSNKAHDGYLGNAVIGEWCNLGAGVNASNLKNDYSKIRIWNYPRHTFMRTDLQFCGLIMGDHSKAGINCMFNTATVVGVGCNLHGAGFPRVFVPSFCTGSPSGGLSDVGLKKFYEVAERVMSRRGIILGEGDRIIYERVYEVASKYKW